jgi:hypothetical protein
MFSRHIPDDSVLETNFLVNRGVILGPEYNSRSWPFLNPDFNAEGTSLPCLENRDYGRRGSVALTMRHPSIRKSWY